MRIGILAPVGVDAFLEYFNDDYSRDLIELNKRPSSASAIVTLVKGFLNKKYFVRLITLTKTDFYIKSDLLEIVGVKRCDFYLYKYSIGVFINSSRIRKRLGLYSQDLDVIHAHWTYEYAFAAKYYESKLPVFCTVRDFAPIIFKFESLKNKVQWSFKYIMNELVFMSRNVNFISNSPYTHSLLERRYKIDTPIIPNPIKGSFLLEGFHKEFLNIKVLCVSSTLDKRKNIDNLLIAFSELLKVYPDSELTLVGAAFTNNNSFVRDWNKKRLTRNVNLIGQVPHDKLIKYYDNCSVFVTPSLEETFGNTLLEAMARKVPIIAGQNSGAIPYVLREGKAGFLCNVSDPNDILKTIQIVHRDKELVNDKVNWAFDLLKNTYLDNQIINRHIELYSSVLK